MPPLLARTSMKQKLNLTRSSLSFVPRILTNSKLSQRQSRAKGWKMDNHKKQRENNTTLPQGLRSSFRLSMEKRVQGCCHSCRHGCSGSVDEASSYLPSTSFYSTRTGSNINQISGSHSVTICCLLPF